ncbi:glycosyltransferase family 2 protein [Motilimonas sp. KMU-193]|uniref:glycosyltransferase family 2 protein n=1 Tax=Motilimonas sp. KMU-193 TaxID=3388668 RepID=UPI00396B2AA0
MDNSILISIVIPCTDRVEGLTRCISSVLSQKIDASIEIVLVENNSKKLNVIKGLVSSINDTRVKHYYLEKCDNANVARNYGANVCNGKYIAFMDSDDWWSDKHLFDCLNEINRGAKAVYSGFILDNGSVQEAKVSRQISQETPYHFLFGSNAGFAQTSSFFLCREVLNQCNWDESLKRSQDYDFFIEVQLKIGWRYKSSLTVFVYWAEGAIRTLSADAFEIFYNKHSVNMSSSEKAEYLCEIVKAFATVSRSDYCKFSFKLNEFRGFLGMKDRIIVSNFLVTKSFLKLRPLLKMITNKKRIQC